MHSETETTTTTAGVELHTHNCFMSGVDANSIVGSVINLLLLKSLPKHSASLASAIAHPTKQARGVTDRSVKVLPTSTKMRQSSDTKALSFSVLSHVRNL